MNDIVTVTLTERGARILNDVPWREHRYTKGDQIKTPLHCLFDNFGGATVGELPFRNLRPVVRVKCQSKRVEA